MIRAGVSSTFESAVDMIGRITVASLLAFAGAVHGGTTIWDGELAWVNIELSEGEYPCFF